MPLLRTLVAVATTLVALTGSVAHAESKQLYRVTAPKEVFDAALPLFHGGLDVWHTASKGDDTFEVQVYATNEQIELFRSTTASSPSTSITRDVVDTSALLESRSMERAACASNSRRRRLQRRNQTSSSSTTTTTKRYVNDAFFDCFREATEVFAFMDMLADENPKLFTKIPNITSTYEGRAVPAYKLSTGRGRKPLYTQALIHAREWIAGASTFYAIAALLDDLRAGNTTTNAVFAEFDWHFVPILNLDGYRYTWSSDRMWRKNRRRLAGGEYGVDLNRNYGPQAYFAKGGEETDAETYPGAAVLSEPETAGSWAYVKQLNPFGVLDMHAFGGFVMRAYGNQRGTPPAPYGPKLKTLGDVVARAAGRDYVSQTSAQMYEAYGCFDDAVFQLLNRPVLTIEMAGESFLADEATIRPSGQSMYRAFLAFAQQIPTYWKGLDNASAGRRRDSVGFDYLTEKTRISKSDR